MAALAYARQSSFQDCIGMTFTQNGKDVRDSAKFQRLADLWKRETRHTSSLNKMVSNPSYLRIIGMGQSAVALLLREIKERPDHWLVALNAITEEDPTPQGATFMDAIQAWLQWGRFNGYID